MELANKCYECVSFSNIQDGKSEYGLCCRLADCAGPSFTVKKEQRCLPLFTRPDKKLSPEEISARDKREAKNYNDLEEMGKGINKIIESWPKWKRDIYYPGPLQPPEDKPKDTPAYEYLGDWQ